MSQLPRNRDLSAAFWKSHCESDANYPSKGRPVAPRGPLRVAGLDGTSSRGDLPTAMVVTMNEPPAPIPLQTIYDGDIDEVKYRMVWALQRKKNMLVGSPPATRDELCIYAGALELAAPQLENDLRQVDLGCEVPDDWEVPEEKQINPSSPQKPFAGRQALARTREEVKGEGRKRKVSLRSYRKVLVNRMCGDTDVAGRLLGFFAKAKKNVALAAAVAVEVLARYSTVGALGRQIGSDMTARAILKIAQGWAAKAEEEVPSIEELVAEGKDVSNNLGKLSGRGSEEVLKQVEPLLDCGDDAVVAAEALFYNRHFVSLCCQERVCPICLASAFFGTDVDIADPQPENTVYPVMALTLDILSCGGQAAMEMAARLHNKEQHALNGNTYLSTSLDELRLGVVAECARVIHEISSTPFVGSPDIAQILRAGEQDIPAVNTIRAVNMGKVVGSTPPSRHQLYTRIRAIVPAVEEAVESEVESGQSATPGEEGGTGSPTRPTPVPMRAPCATGGDEVTIAERVRTGRRARGKRTTAAEGIASDHSAAGGQMSSPYRRRSLGMLSSLSMGVPGEGVSSRVALNIYSAEPTTESDMNAPGVQIAGMGSSGSAQLRELQRFFITMGDNLGDLVPAHALRSLQKALQSPLQLDRPLIDYIMSGEAPFPSTTVSFTPVWIGVGVSPALSRGYLQRTSFGMELEVGVTDPTSRDGRINCAYPKAIWAYVTNAAAIQVAGTQAAGTTYCDLKPLLVKVLLYDRMRQLGPIFPTGTEWGVPQRGAIPREFVYTDKELVWRDRFRHVIITPDVLNSMLVEDHGLVVGRGTAKERWMLSSPDVNLVVLDVMTQDNSVLHALQFVVSLPYPLEWALESFMVSAPDNPLQYDLCTFIRTEGLVTVPNLVKNTIFVVTAQRSTVILGGILQPVHSTDAKGNIPDIEPVDSYDTICGCLGLMNNCSLSLAEVFMEWVKSRCAIPDVNWAEIDTHLNVLCNRFVPQPEVIIGSDYTKKTVWLPPAYISKDFNNDTLPPSTSASSDDDYYASYAVTALGQCYSDLPSAETFPSLQVGEWNIPSELVTGFGLGKFVDSEKTPPNTLKNRARVNPIDGLRRGLFMRRGIEEFQRVAGLADQVVAPQAGGLEPSRWSSIVYGTADNSEGDCVRLVAQDLTQLQGSATYRWDVNLANGVGGTSTGLRTPASMWLTPLSGNQPCTLLGANGYTLQTNVGAMWYENSLAQTGVDLEDAPLLEAALFRLDLLRARKGMITFNTRPDNMECPDFNHRVESAVFNVMYILGGYSGPITPMYNMERLPPPDGWGVPIMIRDWLVDTLRTIVLQQTAFSPVENGQITDLIIQRTPPSASLFIGTGAKYINKTFGFGGRIKRIGENQPTTGAADQEGLARTDAGRDFPTPPNASVTTVVSGPPAATSAKIGADPALTEVNLDHREREDQT